MVTARGWIRAGGWPIRTLLLLLIRAYQLTVGRVAGGRCRFYPSCSEYAALAIREVGAIRGVVFATWRLLRCSPLTAGGVDYPPRVGRPMYDADIHGEPGGPINHTRAGA